ncbi:hypothetical protein ANANG_G00122230 [Anguilla anguilla]|uniref:Uncharacterized protein n=1 Tax=Anguilla anguilla TaxID=7936 RepID=A0A9D3MDL6_ANGAN|nr:hypothetical protein ANANG_G00122230 [Anguilla anguilla]
MGNSYAGQLKTTRFEEVLHSSIEASLRSNNVIPRPVFTQLYLEAEKSPSQEAGKAEKGEEEEEEGAESNSPPPPYHMKPAPEGRCATDGFSGNCVGCGEKGFRYFTEFCNHINLKLTTQPKKQKHLQYYLYRNAQGMLVRGPLICWRGGASPASMTNGRDHPMPQQPSHQSGLMSQGLCRPSITGHGSLPPLCGNVGEVRVSSLLQSCYKSYQALPRVYEQYRASPIQPLSTEMQILLTVYYLVQLGSDQVPLIDDLEQIFVRSWREANLPEIRQCQQPLPPGPTQPVSPTQLPWLAKLATSSSGDSVLILDAPVSLAEGLNETFRSLMEGKLARTNYVVIICTFKGGNTESCVVVTGRCQARALAESMLTPGDCANEISYELAAGKTGELGALLRSLGPGNM